MFVSYPPKGTYAIIHTSGETTAQFSGETTVLSTQQATYEAIDANRTETRHAYVNVCKDNTYDAPLAIVVQYIPPLPADSSKIVQCQKLIVLTYIYIYMLIKQYYPFF